MRALYVLQVLFVSVEALIILLGILTWTYLRIEIQVLANSLSIEAEILKWSILLPIIIAGWIVRETRALLQQDTETVQILTGWPDYWKLKIHTWVSLVYSLLFVCMSVVPWLTQTGIRTASGLLLFLTSIAGQISVAISIYAASMRVNEIIALVKAK